MKRSGAYPQRYLPPGRQRSNVFDVEANWLSRALSVGAGGGCKFYNLSYIVRRHARFWAIGACPGLPRPRGLVFLIASIAHGDRGQARRNVNALPVPPDDPEALANAIKRFADDRALRQRFGTAGRKMVEDEFSSVRVGHAIVGLYDRLLSHAGALLPPRSGTG